MNGVWWIEWLWLIGIVGSLIGGKVALAFGWVAWGNRRWCNARRYLVLASGLFVVALGLGMARESYRARHAVSYAWSAERERLQVAEGLLGETERAYDEARSQLADLLPADADSEWISAMIGRDARVHAAAVRLVALRRERELARDEVRAMKAGLESDRWNQADARREKQWDRLVPSAAAGVVGLDRVLTEGDMGELMVALERD